MATRIEKKRIRDIIVIEKDHRPLIDEAVRRIACSMSEIGLRSPIAVHKGWGRHFLVAGRHRLEAAKSLGWSSIECEIIDDDKVEGRLWNWAENAHRADLTVLQQAEHAEEWDRIVRERTKDGILQPCRSSAR